MYVCTSSRSRKEVLVETWDCMLHPNRSADIAHLAQRYQGHVAQACRDSVSHLDGIKRNRKIFEGAHTMLPNPQVLRIFRCKGV